MTKSTLNLKDVNDLADASNELCVAIEILKIANPEMRELALKTIFQRKDEVWHLLAKFGY